ncbi:MAG TPA: methyltransferase domain-containing protein [Candidatus Saccharimonadales bacterium]|nr:methyltransferase domain-containing protein [Candidatus Saccharimonadales bacterium]
MNNALLGQKPQAGSSAVASDRIDQRYYQSVPPRSLRERMLVAARDRIYEDFLQACRPHRDDTILDVGVSDIINDAANMVERKYPYPDRITAVGLSHAGDFREAFPQVSYTRIEANKPLPFTDKAFDIATSNAVLEHVGSRVHQMQFVSELTRVARRVFISVPNRYFPVEHHTAIPLLHFFDATFHLACGVLDKQEWLQESNLILMSKTALTALTPPGACAQVAYTGIGLGPFSSNVYMLLRDGK